MDNGVFGIVNKLKEEGVILNNIQIDTPDGQKVYANWSEFSNSRYPKGNPPYISSISGSLGGTETLVKITEHSATYKGPVEDLTKEILDKYGFIEIINPSPGSYRDDAWVFLHA